MTDLVTSTNSLPGVESVDLDASSKPTRSRTVSRDVDAAVSDAALLRMSGSNPEHFSEFYRRYYDPVLRYLVRRTGCGQTASDILSETFVAAFRHRRRFDESKGTAEGWLIGIARNNLRHYHRSASRHERRMRRQAAPQLSDDDMARVEAAADMAALRPMLRDALSQLPPNQAEAVQLRIIDEVPYHEIAARLGTSEGNVRVRVSRGLTRLAEIVEVR